LRLKLPISARCGLGDRATRYDLMLPTAGLSEQARLETVGDRDSASASVALVRTLRSDVPCLFRQSPEDSEK